MIYLDHAATSPLRPEVWRAMQELVGEADYNPASVHAAGGRAARVLEQARRMLAESLGAPSSAIVLTGGGTQSDNLAILGFARARGGRARILVSAIEHKAVLESARRAEAEGCTVEVLPVEGDGTLLPRRVKERLQAADGCPTLVSVMWANNEVGTVQPVEEICQAAHRHGALFHTDAVQAFGKRPLSFDEAGVDLLTVTAHKLGGPVGIGVLARREGIEIEPLSYGGAQEGSLWPGTQNPVGARGFAEAARLAVQELPGSTARWTGMRERLEAALRADVPGLVVHGGEAALRLPHMLSVGVPSCDQAVLLTALDLAGLAVSAGSACSSGAHTGSHVLEAMGVTPTTPYAVLRFSFGAATVPTEVEEAASLTIEAIARSREAA